MTGSRIHPIEFVALALLILVGAVIAMNFAAEATMNAPQSQGTWAPVLPEAHPDVLSIRLRDEDTAHDLWAESLSIGESTCLTEMPDNALQGGGLRFWLHSCPRPRFVSAN